MSMSPSTTNDLADRMRALGDISAIRILRELSEGKSVNEISHDLELPQSSVSKRLRSLLRLGFVRMEQQGKKHYYSLRPDIIEDLCNLLSKLFNKN